MKKINCEPLLSVVVPIYNTEEYLRECLDSIVNQTYRNLEIILVDDGSTDNSREIADEYASNDYRIKVIHKKNGGIVSARKEGIAVATGNYATQIDSDDWIDLDYYEKMMKYVIDNDPDVVTSGNYREYTGYKVEEYDRVRPGNYNREKLEKEIFPYFMSYGDFYEAGINIHIYNKIYKMEVLRKYQLLLDDIIHVGDDAAVVYPLIYNCTSMCVTRICGYHYRMRQGSCMDTMLDSERTSLDALENHLKTYISENDKKVDVLLLYLRLLQIPGQVLREGLDIFGFDEGDSIIIYGKGRFGKALIDYCEESGIINVVSWIDSNDLYTNGSINETIKNKIASNRFKILIAVLRSEIRNTIKTELLGLGIDSDNIIKWKV